MRSKTLAVILLALLASVTARATVFQVNVAGNRRFQNGVGESARIGIQPVRNLTFFQAFHVSPANYVLTYDSDSTGLQLTPKKASAGLPTLFILFANNGIISYNSTVPLGFLSFYAIASGGNAAGTEFAGLNGSYRVQTNQRVVNNMMVARSIQATVNAAATTGNPKSYLYSFSFVSTKVFVQAP